MRLNEILQNLWCNDDAISLQSVTIISIFDGFHVCIASIHIIPKIHHLIPCEILSYKGICKSRSVNDVFQNPYLVSRIISPLHAQNQLCLFSKFFFVIFFRCINQSLIENFHLVLVYRMLWKEQ